MFRGRNLKCAAVTSLVFVDSCLLGSILARTQCYLLSTAASQLILVVKGTRMIPYDDGKHFLHNLVFFKWFEVT